MEVFEERYKMQDRCNHPELKCSRIIHCAKCGKVLERAFPVIQIVGEEDADLYDGIYYRLTNRQIENLVERGGRSLEYVKYMKEI